MIGVLRYFLRSPLLFALSGLLLFGSCAAKKLRKQAFKLEQAGLLEDAAELYRRSLLKQSDNIEAKLGLRKNGQIMLDRKTEKFLKIYNTGTSKAAVYAFRDAKKYQELVKSAGVRLDFPEDYQTYYEDKKSEYLEGRYLEGRSHLDTDEFGEAERTFKEILSFDSQFKDSRRQLNVSHMEPLYRKGEKALNQEQPRSAYYLFSEVLGIDPSYRDTQALKLEAKQAATLRIVLISFVNESEGNASKRLQLQSEVQSRVNQIKSPFLEFIDGNSISAYDDHKLEKARKLGGHALLTGTIFELRALEGRVSKKTEKGYLETTKEITKEDGTKEKKIEYQKIAYNTYQKENKANLSIRYRLISTKGQQILLSNAINLSKDDRVAYARTKLDYKKLVPGYWKYAYKKSERDKVSTSSYSVRKLRNEFKQKDTIIPSKRLLLELMNEAGNRIKKEIQSFNPEEQARVN